MLVLAICVAAPLTLAWLYGNRESPPERGAARYAADGAAVVDPPSAHSGATAAALVGAGPRAAVILPGTPSAATTVAFSAVPAASASTDTVALGQIFAPLPKSAPAVPTRRTSSRRSSATTDDSDVTLLAALIEHVEVGSPAERKKLERLRNQRKPAQFVDSVEVRMQACPAANTVAGLRCRKKVCQGHAGQAAACPASQANDD